MAYQGFLGSEATRFPEQDTMNKPIRCVNVRAVLSRETTDIHITDWLHNPALPHIRQYPGPVSNPAGGPPLELWVPLPAYLHCLQIVTFGPSSPDNLIRLSLHSFTCLLASIKLDFMLATTTIPYAGFDSEQWWSGYCLPWSYELGEQHQFQGQPRNLYCYKHGKRRPDMQLYNTQMPHKVIEVLHFGMQINQYR
ncbi:hypothetical protein J3A83DRAFT_4085768, partial [Scleroderma citrinum]